MNSYGKEVIRTTSNVMTRKWCTKYVNRPHDTVHYSRLMFLIMIIIKTGILYVIIYTYTTWFKRHAVARSAHFSSRHSVGALATSRSTPTAVYPI